MPNKNTLLFLLAASIIVHFTVVNCHAQIITCAPVVPCRMIRHFPHDINSFTQGLLYHAGSFYESTGKHGRSGVKIIDPESGEVRGEERLDKRFFGEGLCFWNDQLYQLTWREGKCFVYDSRSLARKGVFKYRGQGWGLTTDGKFLFQSNGSSLITLRDPYDFKRISKLQISDGGRKVYRINELEYISGIIYCNIWQEDLIAAVDSLSGSVLFWLDISDLRPLAGPEAEAANGIAWDSEGKRLFVTGKFWDKIFQIELPTIAGKKASGHLYD